MEPALFGLQVTHGPDMSDFPDTKRMDDSGVALEVQDSAGLADAWLSAVNPETRESIKRACQNYFSSAGGAAKRSWEVIRDRAKL
jgi:3-deoxy-D-manno-octulosonic-acid transferase